MSEPGGIVLAAFTRAGALLTARLAGVLGGRAFVPGRCLVPGTKKLLQMKQKRWRRKKKQRLISLLKKL